MEFRGGAVIREKVLGYLKGMKVDTSPGADGLHTMVLKEVALYIVETLIVIF